MSADQPVTCTCYEVDPEKHYVHYGITEPGSMFEPNPDCLVHFPPDQPVTLTDQERGDLYDGYLDVVADADSTDLTALGKAVARMIADREAAAFERGRQALAKEVRERITAERRNLRGLTDGHAPMDYMLGRFESVLPPVVVDAHTSSEQEAQALHAAADAWDESRPASVRPTAVAEWLRRRAAGATSSEQEDDLAVGSRVRVVNPALDFNGYEGIVTAAGVDCYVHLDNDPTGSRAFRRTSLRAVQATTKGDET